jgi:hypothetical protein
LAVDLADIQQKQRQHVVGVEARDEDQRGVGFRTNPSSLVSPYESMK